VPIREQGVNDGGYRDVADPWPELNDFLVPPPMQEAAPSIANQSKRRSRFTFHRPAIAMLDLWLPPNQDHSCQT
jgi:hypothetical protein